MISIRLSLVHVTTHNRPLLHATSEVESTEFTQVENDVDVLSGKKKNTLAKIPHKAGLLQL